jgi:hypothetical protein
MLRALVFAGGLALGTAGAAPAPAQPTEAPLYLSTEAAPEDCKEATGNEVVVCGERGPSPYRIDPDVLGAMRAEELAANPPRPPGQVAEGDPCNVGPNGCPGEGALPLMAIALTAAEMAVKAIQGEDWREPLRTGPDDYQRYEEAKRKRERAKPRVSVGVGVRN